VEVVPGKCFTCCYFHLLGWTEPEKKKHMICMVKKILKEKIIFQGILKEISSYALVRIIPTFLRVERINNNIINLEEM
jgi:hypothetical protein